MNVGSSMALALVVALAACHRSEASDGEAGDLGNGVPEAPARGSGRGGEAEPPPPPGFASMVFPPSNPYSAAKAELGRHLFYDKRLSGNGTQSCASCHVQERAFTDGRATPVGSTGDIVPRNAQTLANVGYLPVLTWANPLLRDLETQARVPLLNDLPVELGAGGREAEIVERLRQDSRYEPLVAAAFPGEASPWTFARLVDALATFERTLVSADAPYDRYARGDTTALTEEAQAGLALFNSERCECYHCHSGFTFTSALRTKAGESFRGSFANTGLYNVDGRGGYPEPNTGLADITERPEDMGKFRVPTLRNVEVTGPYMHDGSVATLEEVLDHYAAGGRDLATGPHAGRGTTSPRKDPLVPGFRVSDEEKRALLAFLRSLTDEVFLHDVRFSSPWPEESGQGP